MSRNVSVSAALIRFAEVKFLHAVHVPHPATVNKVESDIQPANFSQTEIKKVEPATLPTRLGRESLFEYRS